MKTPFKVLLLALAVLVQPFAERAGAATLRLQDTVVGTWAQNGANFQTKHTMHYYYFTALIGAPFSASLCLSVAGPENNTSLDFHLAQRPNNQGEINAQLTIGLVNSAPCDQIAGFLPAGQYLLVCAPRNSDWGSDPHAVPFEYADSRFDSFTYDLTFSGDVRLDSITKGNLDGTWTTTVVPEPSEAPILMLGGLTLGLFYRTRRRMAVAATSLPTHLLN